MGSSPASVIARVCLAQVLTMTGVMAFPAMLPMFRDIWALSNAEAGWISGLFFGGYAVFVPVLVTLTDRIDARRIYLACCIVGVAAMLGFAFLASGFWSALTFRILGGIALAGTYMPGLRALGDRIEGKARARAVSFYTAFFSVGMAASVFLAGRIDAAWGWQAVFLVGAAGPLLAAPIFASAIRAKEPEGGGLPVAHLVDPRPVLRNRPAMGYALGYAAHCFELFGFRGWIVAFLAFAAMKSEAGTSVFWDPHTIATLVLLLGVPASILGNESALRFGRVRALSVLMVLSGLAALVLGALPGEAYWLVVAVSLLYGITIMWDSSALTTGMVDAADPARRGATMAVYSFAGFTMAFVAPVIFGIALDLGGEDGIGWWLGFAALGAGVATGPLWLRLMSDRKEGAA